MLIAHNLINLFICQRMQIVLENLPKLKKKLINNISHFTQMTILCNSIMGIFIRLNTYNMFKDNSFCH